MSQPTYRPEDQFQERLNGEKLKELFRKKDYQGLLDFALLLNHQCSFNNSRVHFALAEAAKNMAEEFRIEKYQSMIKEIFEQ